MLAKGGDLRYPMASIAILIRNPHLPPRRSQEHRDGFSSLSFYIHNESRGQNPDMRIYDLSQPMEKDMQIYPGDPIFSCQPIAKLEKDGYNVTSLAMGSHTGTHIDAPYHFVKNGKKCHELPLEDLVGSATVVKLGAMNLRQRQRITWDNLVQHDPAAIATLEKGPVKIVFVQTGWSRYWKTSEYLEHPYLDRNVAIELLQRGVRVLGVDTLSPDETHQPDFEGEGDFGVHEELLGAGAMIVENLTALDQLPPGPVFASLLPLKIEGCDGSPIRAVAWDDGSDGK